MATTTNTPEYRAEHRANIQRKLRAAADRAHREWLDDGQLDLSKALRSTLLARLARRMELDSFPLDGAAASRAERPGNTAKAAQATSSGQEPELQLDSPSTSRPCTTEPEA